MSPGKPDLARIAKELLSQKKDTKCDYRKMSPPEIKKYDPHGKKGRGGGKQDLFVCRPSGNIVIAPKTWHYDKDGIPEFPRGTEYEPTGDNINDPDFKAGKMALAISNQTRIDVDFVVEGFSQAPKEALRALQIGFHKSTWEKGEHRTPKLVYKDNGFRISADNRNKSFEDKVTKLVERMYPYKEALLRICGNYVAEVSCAVYIVGDNVPALNIPHHTLTQIAELRADVDFDVYLFPLEKAG